MKNLLGVLAVLSLGGCATADHVTKPTKSQYAPKDYKPIGVVKYLNQGADSVIESRREDAFKQMYEACAGEYKILQESEKPDNFKMTTYNAVTNSLDTFSNNYWYIQYSCNN